MQTDNGTVASVSKDFWYGLICGVEVTEDLGAGRLSARSLPPLPAEEADLVGHHTLLELVLRCHWTAHLAGAAFKGGNFHHVVDKGQCEAEAAQDVGVLLLLKGCQGGGYRGKAGMPGRAAHLELCQWHIPAYRSNTRDPKPPTPLLWAGTAKLSPEPAHYTSSSSTVTAASNHPRPDISRQLPEKLVRLAPKLHAPFSRRIPALWDSFRSQPGRGSDHLRHRPSSGPHHSNAATKLKAGVDFMSDNLLRHRKLQTQCVPPHSPTLT